MDNYIFSVILMVVILMGASFYVMAPVLRRKTADLFADEYEDTPIHHLLSRKDSIYMAIKDLEFDYSTGKLSEEDYADLREKFSAEAATVIAEVEVMRSGGQPEAKSTATATIEPDSSCAACGFTYEPGDKFCQSCGADIT